MRLRVSTTRFPNGGLLWLALCVLLGIGVLAALAALWRAPDAELLDANSNGQRVIIDPVSGHVSGLPEAATDAFEVGDAAPPVPKDITPDSSGGGHAPADAPALRTTAEEPTLPELPLTHDSIVVPPAPEITETGAMLLPRRGDKNITPAELYAGHFARQPKQHLISLVLTHAGMTNATVLQILKLPHEVTVAFTPYAPDPAPQIALLHRAGIETWGMLPSQGTGYPQDDPGPLGLIRGQAPEQQKDRLLKVMSATLGAVGLVLQPDDTLSVRDDFAGALKEIDARGLLLLSTYPARSVDEITHDPAQQKIIHRGDVVLDADAPDAVLTSKLSGLPALAEQHDLVVLMRATPHGLRVLADWLKDKPFGDDVALAPLSAQYGTAAPEAESKDDAHHDDAKKEGE